MTSHEHLSQVRQRVNENTRLTKALVQELSASHLLWQPDEDRWSIAQCFEHLLVTGKLYYPRVKTALTQANAANPDTSYSHSWFGRLFLSYSAPEIRRPIRTFSVFQPVDATADSPAAFVCQQEELVELIQEAEGKDLRAKVRSPASRFLSLRVGETLDMLALHQRRHIVQAERVRAKEGFPDALKQTEQDSEPLTDREV